MKKTDIKKIQELATAFAYLPIEPNPKIPFFVSHPYIESVPTMLPGEGGVPEVINPLENGDDLRRFTDNIVRHIQETDTAIGFFLMLSKSYRFTFLDHIKIHLSNDDLAECLRYIWKNSEYTNSGSVFTKKQLLSLFRRSTKEKLMDDDELQVFHGLSERTTVYRGVTSINSKDLNVFSWTLSLERARWFAARYDDKIQEVFRAELPREGVLAYFSDEEEIIANPFMLENIMKLQ